MLAFFALVSLQVVHGGWMHKLGEGLGGWTTRYFTLAHELEAAPAQVGVP